MSPLTALQDIENRPVNAAQAPDNQNRSLENVTKMALKVEIKPGERIIIGDALITNDGHRTRLFIEGDAPILREKDIMRPDDADTPCKKIYLLIQMMYLADDPRQHHKLYFQLIDDILKAAPSTLALIDQINNQILAGSYYKALKLAKNLIAYEKELMDNAKRS
ncbi:MAG: flagellar biosynthesis repressor FlbT [Methyloligellaceae bacterium]